MANNDSVEDRYGRNVRRFRKEAGLSQGQLAEKLREHGVDLHPSAIAKIETRDVQNPRSVRLNEAQAIADALDVDLRMLTGSPRRGNLKTFTVTQDVRKVQVRYLRDAEDALSRAQEDVDRARRDVDELRLMLDRDHRDAVRMEEANAEQARVVFGEADPPTDIVDRPHAGSPDHDRVE
ncbi:MAG TPA: helix-turn-helix transcriptional regulator [Candidatus Janibacter merdipullorum]|nr:helix-turn-helix transcriptional regulator [Candidatus Janibacter merdipullorum]